MREIVADIWDYLGKAALCITTNGQVSASGKGVLGRGCAAQARERFPDLELRLGALLSAAGNHVHLLAAELASFPVEETPWSNPDLKLIARSARELVLLAERQGWREVVVPRPGCGGGGLSWREVRPLLEPVLDDRFLVISAPP
jgi:hypothetical protein